MMGTPKTSGTCIYTVFSSMPCFLAPSLFQIRASFLDLKHMYPLCLRTFTHTVSLQTTFHLSITPSYPNIHSPSRTQLKHVFLRKALATRHCELPCASCLLSRTPVLTVEYLYKHMCMYKRCDFYLYSVHFFYQLFADPVLR